MSTYEWDGWGDPDDETARTLRAIAECPHHGAPIPKAPGCATCGDLDVCRLGKGRTPGRVTLTDCLACLGLTAPKSP